MTVDGLHWPDVGLWRAAPPTARWELGEAMTSGRAPTHAETGGRATETTNRPPAIAGAREQAAAMDLRRQASIAGEKTAQGFEMATNETQQKKGAKTSAQSSHRAWQARVWWAHEGGKTGPRA